MVPTQRSLSQPLWSYSLHSIVGETGTDGRYTVHTSFPHFAFGYPGRAIMAFLGNAEFVSTGSVALIFTNLDLNVVFSSLLRVTLFIVESEPRTGLG